MEDTKLYELLGVDRNASSGEIKKVRCVTIHLYVIRVCLTLTSLYLVGIVIIKNGQFCEVDFIVFQLFLLLNASVFKDMLILLAKNSLKNWKFL